MATKKYLCRINGFAFYDPADSDDCVDVTHPDGYEARKTLPADMQSSLDEFDRDELKARLHETYYAELSEEL